MAHNINTGFLRNKYSLLLLLKKLPNHKNDLNFAPLYKKMIFAKAR
jgi:hypothetical protein